MRTPALTLLLVLAAFPASAETLTGTFYSSCAPWDGAALSVTAGDYSFRLWGETLTNLKSGQAIELPENGNSSSSPGTLSLCTAHSEPSGPGGILCRDVAGRLTIDEYVPGKTLSGALLVPSEQPQPLPFMVEYMSGEAVCG